MCVSERERERERPPCKKYRCADSGQSSEICSQSHISCPGLHKLQLLVSVTQLHTTNQPPMSHDPHMISSAPPTSQQEEYQGSINKTQICGQQTAGHKIVGGLDSSPPHITPSHHPQSQRGEEVATTEETETIHYNYSPVFITFSVCT